MAEKKTKIVIAHPIAPNGDPDEKEAAPDTEVSVSPSRARELVNAGYARYVDASDQPAAPAKP